MALMKRNYRWIFLILAAALLASILAGCGGRLPVSPEKPADTAATQTEESSPAAVETPDPAGNPATPGPSMPSSETTGANSLEDGFSILFLDVGQADAMLLTCGSHHMLVDGGNVADSSLVASVLLQREIDTLDYVVCTHAHEDHVGGLPGALSVAQAETILAPVATADNTPFTDFVRIAAEQGVAITVPQPDTTYALGEAQFQILGPRQDYDDTNNTSLVLLVTYGDTRFLLTGDMERDAEQDLLDAGCDLTADLLKVGHHGSDSSTSYAFLNAVMPQCAVIQVGADNDYGHPREEVLSRLRDAGTTVYRTDLQGDILAKSDGQVITVTPERNTDVQTNPTEPAQTDGAFAYIGNLRSLKFHLPTCGSLPAEKNRIYFAGRAEAVAAGYDPCVLCNP